MSEVQQSEIPRRTSTANDCIWFDLFSSVDHAPGMIQGDIRVPITIRFRPHRANGTETTKGYLPFLVYDTAAEY